MREAHALAWALKWEAASQKYREALAEVPDDATARVSLAVALSRIGRNEEALQEYLLVRRQLPRDTLVVGRIADLYLRLGQRGPAVQSYLDLADLCLSRSESDKAADAWRRALEQAAGHRGLLLDIRESVVKADFRELLPEIETALAEAPVDDSATPGQRGRQAVEAEAPTPALDRPFQSGDDVAPVSSLPTVTLRTRTDADPAHLLLAAQRHEASGHVASAVACYLRVAEISADADDATRALGAAAELQGEWLPGDLAEALALPEGERSVVLDALAEAHRFLQRGLLTAALDESVRAIAAGPTYLPAQVRLADVYRQMGRVDEARARIGTVADLYELRGEHGRAAAALRRQVSIEPEEAAVWDRLVECYQTAGQPEQAAEALFERARYLLDRGDVAGALERQRQALRMAPLAGRWLRHGLLLESLGRAEEALMAFAEARTLAPAEERVAAAQSRCEALLGRWPEMEANLEVVTATVPGDPVVRDSVLEQYREALSRSGGSAALTYCLGVVLQAFGQTDEAVAHLARVAAEPTRPGRLASFRLAEIHLARGEDSAAVDYLWRVGDPATAETPADRSLAASSYRLLADVCHRRRDWDSTARALTSLLVVDPDEESLYPRLAEARFSCGQVGEAVAALDRLADLYLSRGNGSHALAVYRGMIQLAPESAEPREKLGRLYLSLGQRAEALVELEQAASARGAAGEIAEAAADLRQMLDASRQQDAARALALRERLAALTPGDLDLRRELVAAYLKAGRSVRALAEARSLLDHLLAEGRLEDAASAARLVIQLDPWAADEQIRLAGILAKLGQTDEAVATLRQVLARTPGNQRAMDELFRLQGGATEPGEGGASGPAS